MLRLSRRGFNCNVVRQMRIVYGGVRGPIFTFAHGAFTSGAHGREWVLLMWTRFDPMCEDDPSYFVDIKSNSRWTSWALQRIAAYYFLWTSKQWFSQARCCFSGPKAGVIFKLNGLKPIRHLPYKQSGVVVGSVLLNSSYSQENFF